VASLVPPQGRSQATALPQHWNAPDSPPACAGERAGGMVFKSLREAIDGVEELVLDAGLREDLFFVLAGVVFVKARRSKNAEGKG